MNLIYTQRRRGFEPGRNYRNPRFFAGIDKAATSVIVEGNHPAVVAAYEAAGIKVEVVGTEEEFPDDAETSEQTNGQGLEPAADELTERAELAAQYEDRFGEKPHHAMKADTIRQKLDESGEKPQE